MFKKIKKDHLELVCPDCSGSTKVKTENGVQCSTSECQASFKGMVFKQKKIFKASAAYLIVAGAVGGIAFENSIEDSRLPYAAEYKLMDVCLNRRSGMVDVDKYTDRIDVCSCAVRKAVNSLGVARDRNEPDEVLDAFYKEVRGASGEC